MLSTQSTWTFTPDPVRRTLPVAERLAQPIGIQRHPLDPGKIRNQSPEYLLVMRCLVIQRSVRLHNE